MSERLSAEERAARDAFHDFTNHRPSATEVELWRAVVNAVLAAHLADVEARLAAVEALATRAREATRDTENPGAATVWLASLEAALHPDPSEPTGEKP